MVYFPINHGIFNRLCIEDWEILPWIAIIRVPRSSPCCCPSRSHWMSWNLMHWCRLGCPMESWAWFIHTWIFILGQFSFVKFINKFLKKICIRRVPSFHIILPKVETSRLSKIIQLLSDIWCLVWFNFLLEDRD